MSFLSRIRDLVTGKTDKGFNSPGSTQPNFLQGGGYGPHEPFAGAWQRNLDSARGAGPNLLANSGVYTCINIISSDISRMPPQVKQRGPKGNFELHPNHPAQRVLMNPNTYQNYLQFTQQYMVSKLTHGNAYVLLLRDARGVPNEMHVLDPSSVTPLVASEGSIFYRIGADTLTGTRDGLTVPSRDIIHDRCPGFFHHLIGTSPLFAACASAMMGSRVLTNSANFFANMSRSSGVLMAPGKIDPLVAKKLQTEWEQNYGNGGLGRTAVLSNGLTYTPMTINAADAELVNQLRWTIEDVARCYRVPGYKLGDLNRVTFKNSEQMARDYQSNALAFHTACYQACMHDAFSMPLDVKVELDTSELFRMDTDARYNAHQSALTSGFKSINEVRMEEDLPPVKGGEEPRVQMQYVPLSAATGVPAAVPGGKPSPAPMPDGNVPPAHMPDGNVPPAEPPNPDDPASNSYVGPLQQRMLDFEGLEDAVEIFAQKLNGADNGA